MFYSSFLYLQGAGAVFSLPVNGGAEPQHVVDLNGAYGIAYMDKNDFPKPAGMSLFEWFR